MEHEIESPEDRWRAVHNRAPYFINDTRCADLNEALATAASIEGFVRFTDAAGTVWFEDDTTDADADFSGLDELDARAREYQRDSEHFDAMADEYEGRLELAFGKVDF